MAKKQTNVEITLVTIEKNLFTSDEAGSLTDIHPQMIEEFETGGLVTRAETSPKGAPLFNEAGLCRLRILSNLIEKEKLSLRMTRVICRLMDRLERAEAEVRHLRNRNQ